MIRQLRRAQTGGFRYVDKRCFFSNPFSSKERKGVIQDNEQDPKNLNREEGEEEFKLNEYDEFDDDHYTDYLPPPWHTLLGPPARASWRVSAPRPPQALAQAQFHLIQNSGRTSKQLKRTHRRILQNHTQLAQRRERERRRLKEQMYRRRSNKIQPDSLQFKKERNKDTDIYPVYYQPEYSIASLQQRLLPNYAIVQRVLKELHSLLPRFQPHRVLDFGYGGGGSSIAAIDIFRPKQNDNKDKNEDDNNNNNKSSPTSIQWIHGIEPSQSMRDSASFIFDNVMNQKFAKHTHPPPRLTLTTSLAATDDKHKKTPTNSTSNFDLVMMNYTALEIPHIAATLAAAASLWEKLNVGGVFVMIEPGTPDGFNSIRSVRSMLLDCCPPTRMASEIETMHATDECHIIAPCTHNDQCPMERHRLNALKKKKKKKTDQNADSENDGENSADDEVDDDEEDDDEIIAEGGKIGQTSVFDSAFCSFVHVIPGGNNLKKGEKISYLIAQKRSNRVPNRNNEGNDNNKTTTTTTTTTTTVEPPLENIPNIRDLLAECFDVGKNHHPNHKKKKRNYRAGGVNNNNTNNDDDDDDDEARKQKSKELFERAQQVQIQLRFDSPYDDNVLDPLVGDAYRSSFGRIIRAPIKRKGHVLLDFCTGASPRAHALDENKDKNTVMVNNDSGDNTAEEEEESVSLQSQNLPQGRIVRHRMGKQATNRIAPGMFPAARKARWGGLWPNLVDHIGNENIGLQIIPDDDLGEILREYDNNKRRKSEEEL